MAETKAVPGGPEPTTDAGPEDAVPPRPARNAYEEHPPGPAALYDPPVPAPLHDPPAPLSGPGPVPGPPAPSTGWTVTGMPAVGGAADPPAASAPPVVPPPPGATPLPFTVPGATPAHGLPGAGGGLAGGPRGRILVIEGGYGSSGRRAWGRGGPAQAPVLSAMLAAVSPQVLLAADAVDAVHLPGASDPHTVLAHLRAAARHPGPLLVHLGGHLLADKRGGQLHLTLRDSKPGSIRQDGLAWQAVAGELRHRPAEWQTLVIADLSADQNAWPLLQGAGPALGEGLPLWAVVSPDPEQIGTFTRALIEALHGGRPGAEAVLAPEQLRQQVYSVLRPDVIVFGTHAPDRPFFRNTARRGEGPFADTAGYDGPSPAAVLPRPAAQEDAGWDDRPWGAPLREAVPQDAVPQDAVARDSVPRDAVPQGFLPQDSVPHPRSAVTLDKSAAAPAVADAPAAPARAPEGPVSLLKPGVPPTPSLPSRPVDLRKANAWQPPVDERSEPVDEPVRATPPVRSDAEPARAAGPAEPTARAAEDAPAEAEAEAEAEADEALAPAPADSVPADTAPADAVPADAAPVAGTPVPEVAQPRADYLEVIGRIVRSADAGDHAAATDLAFALELEAIAEHGPVSAPVLQVRQVRAHVSRLAGRTAEAADIYREVALALLRSHGAEHPETQHAATNAEACWRAIPDRAEALRIAPEIIELRAHLPGPGGRKLRAAERHLASLAGPAPEPT
ncbi:hypothetical protein ACFCX4_17785 [Kitasatospora sp. NPDC056327]|uniref:hypothetical protein n=1 Tax=Kitasatospora sp. NPDC056327 TaxID=3345785 RepID=UPI0035DBFAAC